MNRFIGILGIFAILGIAYLLSNNKKKIQPRIIIWGLSLQILFGIFILVTPIGKPVFSWFDKAINKLLSFSQEGSSFLFASFIDGKMHPAVINFAFYVLPTVIFFSALMSVLYHLGVMQIIIKGIAWIMQRTMKTSGPETTSISANIFVGQTEAPLVIKPFIWNGYIFIHRNCNINIIGIINRWIKFRWNRFTITLRFIINIKSPATASPLTNLDAPSIEPKKSDS